MPDVSLKDSKSADHRDVYNPYLLLLFKIAKKRSQLSCSRDECTKKTWNIYKIEGFSPLALGNKIIRFLGKWMKLKIIMLSKISHTQKNVFSYMWNFKCMCVSWK